MLGGTVRPLVAIEAEWRVCAKTAEARVIAFEALFITREAYMQEEIARL